MTKSKRPTAARYLVRSSLLALLLAGLYLYILTLPVSNNAAPVEFEIKKGESVKSIASRLSSQKLLRSPLFFRLIVRQNKLTIQAGLYQLSPSLPPNELARTLTRGLSVDKKLTIPEGYRREQIAELTGLNIVSPEGRLFPDTYFIKADITAPELVDLMQANFAKKVGDIDQETLILASLVERETRGDAEKPIVAGILKKRLEAGWALELDATVQYFLGKPGAWWPNTTLLDRKLASPYNTYLHPGLPPAPIGNPGLASINAVRNSQDSPYWFYLHDKSGTIRYGETLSAHNANIAKYINP